MTADPQNSISEITETGDNEFLADVIAFTLAVGLGGVAGSALFLFVATPALLFTGIAQGEIAVGIGMALMSLAPVVTALQVTFFAMLLIGLPITWILKRLSRESIGSYTTIFGLIGPVVAFVYCLSSTGAIGLAILATIHGLLAGLVCGRLWGRHREALASEPLRDDPDPPENPYHDMIY